LANKFKVVFFCCIFIQHEYIEPILRISSGDSSTIIIQKFNEKVISLRDYISGVVCDDSTEIENKNIVTYSKTFSNFVMLKSKINLNYLRKYSLQKTYQTMQINQIKQIGKKILLALQFLYSKGIFYGHLHAGNVLIEPTLNTVKLTDLPNALLGLPYFYRNYIIEHRKIQV
jgi:serine/threonine protein kinase